MSVGTGYVGIRPELEAGWDREIKSGIESGLGRVAGEVASKIGSTFAGAAKTIGSDLLTIGKTGATVFAGLGASIVAVGASYNTLEQTSRAAFTTILGSAEAAEQMMSRLREFASTSPFPRQAFIEATQQLLGFGVEADKIVPILGAVQDAVAAIGGGSAEIETIVDVFARIQSQGKITGVELQRLGAVGIDAVTMLAEAAGVSADEMRTAISNGAVDSEFAIAALTDGMMARFGGAAENVRETWVGATDRISGAWRDLASDIMQPFITREGGGAAVEWANEFATKLRELQAALGPVTDRIQSMVDVWGPRLSAAIASIDVSRVVDGLVGLMDGLGRVKDSFGDLVPLATGAGVALTSMFASSLPIIGQFLPAISPITGILGGILLGTEQGRDAMSQLGSVFMDVARSSGPAVLGALNTVAGVLTDLVTTVLTTLGPALGDVANAVFPALARAVETLAPPLGEFVAAAARLAAEILPPLASAAASLLEPLATLAGGVLSVVAAGMGFLADHASVLADLMPAVVAGFAAWKLTQFVTDLGGLRGALDGVVAGFSKMAGFLTNPATLIGVGVGALIGGLVLALKDSGSAASASADLIREYAGAIDAAGDAAGGTASAIEEWILSLPSQVSEVFAAMAEGTGVGTKEMADIFLVNTEPIPARLKDIAASAHTWIEPGLFDSWIAELTEVDGALAGLILQTVAWAEAQGLGWQETQELVLGLLQQNDAADEAARRLENLKRSQEEVDTSSIDLAASTGDLRTALVDAAVAIGEGTAASDIQHESFRRASDQAIALAKAQLMVTGDTNAAATALHGQAASLAAVMRQAGLSEAEVQSYLDTLNLTPEDISTTIALLEYGKSMDEVAQWHARLDALPEEEKTAILALLDQGKIDEAERRINETARDRDAPIVARDQNVGNVEAILNSLARVRTAVINVVQRIINADGGLYPGGLAVQSFAPGGLRSLPDQAKIEWPHYPGGLVQWAEPETGGEAFIPLAPSKRDRAEDIWEQVGHIFGRFDRGGLTVQPPRQLAGLSRDGTTVINITVNNPAPEPASRSIERRLRTVAMAGVLGD